MAVPHALLPPGLAGQRARLPGGQRLISKNSLPQHFFLYSYVVAAFGEPAHALVWGTACFSAVSMLGPGLHERPIERQRSASQLADHQDIVLWHMRSCDAFDPPVKLPSTASASWKQIAHLKIGREVNEIKLRARRSAPSLVGRPRAFRIEHAVGGFVFAEQPQYVVTHVCYLDMAGVQRPSTIVAGVDPIVLRASQQDGAVAAPPTPQGVLSLIADNFVAGPSSAVPHVYVVPVLLIAWRLKTMLRSGKQSLKEVVSLALKLACPPGLLDTVLHHVNSGVVKLPGREVLRLADFRINLIDILYQRSLANNNSFDRYWSGDSSPQGGHIFFVVVEDRLMWPSRLSIADRLALDADKHFGRRFLPTTTLGYGGANLLGKACNTQHAAALESGTWAKFCKMRNEVRVWSSDQGVDSAIADCPCLIAEDFSNMNTIFQDLRMKLCC